MSISKELFGKVEEKEVFLYSIKNTNGVIVNITNYGGIVTSIIVADRDGNFDDVVLGYENLSDYLIDTPYFGAIVGRYANRIANGKFKLEGKEYTLSINDVENHLHGGIKGFDKVVWEAREFITETDTGLKLYYHSPEGEEGYPGNLDVEVYYSLTNENELIFECRAITDKETPINISHHSYFNLAGTSGGDILKQTLWIDADKFLPVNNEIIPTGELNNVGGTPMDFRKHKSVGSRIDQVQGGYDHTYVLNNESEFLKVAELIDPFSGRIMEVLTSEPGIQFYSGNFLDGSITGKNGIVYNKHFGLCLETQHFPDSPNKPDFPNTILKPGNVYRQKTIYKFLVK